MEMPHDSTVDLKGKPEEEILRQLSVLTEDDSSFENGRVIGSFCTNPDPFAVRLFQEHIEKNLGDPGLIPGTNRLEKEVVSELGGLLGCQSACGRITGGASEANFLAMWAARQQFDGKRLRVVLSEAAHYSFNKAANALGMALDHVPTNAKGEVDVDELKRRMGEDVAMIIGIAGTTELGAIDDISAISSISSEWKIPLHIDAALGGLILPFAEHLGRPTEKFDFKLQGVTSMAVDPHKMGRTPIPSGLILFRSKKQVNGIAIVGSYLSGGAASQLGITGTRPGAAAVALWGLIQRNGIEGFVEVARFCLTNTEYLVQQLKELEGITVVNDPPALNVVGFRPDKMTPLELDQKLRDLGWRLARHKNHVRAAIMPHVTKVMLERFLDDLHTIVKQTPSNVQ